MRNFFLITAVLAILSSCGPSERETPSITEFSGNAMTINYRVLIGKKLNASEIDKIDASIQEIFHKTNFHLNRWNNSSELSLFNRQKKLVKVKLSDELYDFLMKTKLLVEITQGRFDPTIEPLSELWKSRFSLSTIPSKEEIKDCLAFVGFQHLHFEDGLAWKDFDETALDLGGIAKGYTVDEISKALFKLGYQDHYVEWGGEIRTSGRHPGKRPWRVYISGIDNQDPSSAIALVELENASLATSGDYLQNWRIDNTLYTHIFNISQGGPIKVEKGALASATVQEVDCMTADAIATAMFCFSSQNELEEWLSSLKERFPALKYWTGYRSK